MRKMTPEQFEQRLKDAETLNNILILRENIETQGSSVAVEYVCGKCNQKSTSSLSNLSRGHACKFCGKEKSIESRRFTEEQYAQRVLYLLKNKNIKVLTKFSERIKICDWAEAECCVCGSNIKYKLANYKKVGCSFCNSRRKKTEEEFNIIVERLKERNIQVLSCFSDYKNKKSKFELKCMKCGEKFSKSFEEIWRMKECSVCGKNSKHSKLKFQEVLKKISNFGFASVEPLENVVSLKSRHKFICNICGKTIEKSLDSFLKNKGCPICKKTDGLTEEQYRERVTFIKEKNNIQILTEYKDYLDVATPIKCKCLVCSRIIYPNLNNLMRGSGCIVCNKSQMKSKQEEEVFQFLSLLLGESNIVRREKGILAKKEIDIFIPSLKVGVEFHGLYWHSELNKNRNYHKEKYVMAKKAGVKIIQIFEDEWRDKRPIVESILSHAAGKTQRKISARSCKIIKMTRENERQFADFFENNHIAGNVRCTKAFALVFDGEMVQAISFRKPFTQKYPDAIELARNCSVVGAVVNGGFSRLLSHARKEIGSSVPILTYSDLRFGEGHSYALAGFRYIGTTVPDYYYTEFKKRFNRFQYRARDGKPEKTIAEEAGVVRIYGVGHNIFLLDSGESA